MTGQHGRDITGRNNMRLGIYIKLKSNNLNLKSSLFKTSRSLDG